MSAAFLRWLHVCPTVQPSLDRLERFEARQTEEVRQAAAELRQHLVTIPLPDFVQTAIKALPEAARAVLVLREYGELSYDEIASVLEIPVGTVMSRLNYARTRLRTMLQEYRLETEHAYV